MSKITTIEYNGILNKYNISCDCDEEYINKRKNYIHHCLTCYHLFNTTPSKLLKDTTCPNSDNHEEFIYVNEIKRYRDNLPKHIKLKDGLRDMNKVIRHKCMWCKNIFKISPMNFKKNYKCLLCKT